MRIALAQINTIVGDYQANLQKILRFVAEAHRGGAALVVFPELALCGYPPLDLLYRSSFVEGCTRALDQLAARIPEGIGVIVGGIAGNPASHGKPLHNAAFYVENGRIRTYYKQLLPSYDVFDECRYYAPGQDILIIEKGPERIGVTICEDIWHVLPELRYAHSPMDRLAREGVSLVVNLSASPFSIRHDAVRQKVLALNVARYGVPMFYVSMVGGQTHLLFDGGTRVMMPDGSMTAEAPFFEEALLWVEKKGKGWEGRRAPQKTDEGELIRQALVMALRDYFDKLGLKRRVVVGVSGGIDSAVVTALAVEALGPDAVLPVFLPSRYSSEETWRLVDQLLHRIGLAYEIVSIDEHFAGMLKQLRAHWGNLPGNVTEENIQARLRQTLLMAYANREGAVMLNTSNKSELAVGYGTLYGDMAGGVSVIGDVLKTQVYRLAQAINAVHGWIPEAIVTRPPSAELKADQKDEDTLPPYSLLDPILVMLIEKEMSVEEIVGAGYPEGVVRRVAGMVRRNEYKRYQFPNIFRVSDRAFGYGRRVPIVARWQ